MRSVALADAGVFLGVLALGGFALPRLPSAGDLDGILARGELRVVLRPDPAASVSPESDPVAGDRALAEDLARALGLRLVPLVETDLDRMLAALVSGRADVAAASLTRTARREGQVAFSTPYRYVDELLVVRAAAEPAAERREQEVCLRRGSAQLESFPELRSQFPTLGLRRLAPGVTVEGALDLVVRGDCYAAAVDSHFWGALAPHYPALTAAFTVADRRPIALALRRGAPALKRRINEFLTARALGGAADALSTGDWAEIRRRGVLRVLTRNSALSYFLHRGRPVGFEYALLSRFAGHNGLRLAVVVPPRHDALLPWLREGRGDLVAAAMSPSRGRSASAGFTRPYYVGDAVVAVREGSPAALAGRRIALRRSSSFVSAFRRLRRRVRAGAPAFAPEDLEDEEILAAVEAGRWDAALCDAPLLELERAAGRRLRAAAVLKNESKWAWATRPENPELRRALDDFIRREYRGLEYNLIRRRSLEPHPTEDTLRPVPRPDPAGRLSPYDDWLRRYAAEHELDWRLVAAVMFEESGFDPGKVSWAGAVGLMQLMPETARTLGVEDLSDPRRNIEAGARYLRYLLDAFGGVPLRERLHFALAAYNAGIGHVEDARRLAGESGLSPDVWAGGVEKAMLLLSEPRHYKQARYGYCRGFEAVRFVSVVEDRYRAYAAALK